MPNILFYGDNLEVLRKRVKDESVDLIYLDPPFNSKRDYNVIFKEADGNAPAAQIRAFGDTWQYTQETARAQEELSAVAPASGCPQLPLMLDGFVDVLGRNDVTAYLMMMAIRLLELKRALKPTGSIYLHCDPTMAHYLKTVVMDIIFGKTNFRNEIVWKRTSAHSSAKRYGPVDDRLLFYTKSDVFTWNVQHTAYDEDYIRKFYRHVEPETGRRYRFSDLTGSGVRHGETGKPWRGVNPTDKGRHWMVPPSELEKWHQQGRICFPPSGGVPAYKRYLDEMSGVTLQTVWTDIPPIGAAAAERLGYPTQKPEALLERIIKASSNEGGVVLDPFCGCGTTISVAQRLNRQWMGIDITHLAIAIIKKRLADQFDLKAGKDYQVIGEPADVASAAELARSDPYQFQWWALSLIPAFPTADDKKKGADKGIDGLVYFVDGANRKTQKIVVQVKGGHVSVAQIRDLRGVVEREKAAMGFFVCLEPPTQPMLTEAAGAGFYKSGLWQGAFPRLQIRTVAELLDGKNFDHPRQAATTFRQAARAQVEAGQEALDL